MFDRDSATRVGGSRTSNEESFVTTQRVVFTVAAGLGAFFMASSPAALAQDLYLRADAGGAGTDDFGASIVYGGGVGFNLPLGFRTDATLSYRGELEVEQLGAVNDLIDFTDLSVNTPGLDSLSAFAGLYYDIPDPIPFIEPFVGAGVGATRFDPDTIVISGEDLGSGVSFSQDASTTGSYFFTGGLALDLFDRIALDVAYRYSDLGEVEFDGALTGTDFPGLGGEEIMLDQFSRDVKVHEGIASIRITL